MIIIQLMIVAQLVDSLSMCANCGKGEEESGKLKSCNACKEVQYCNRDCQLAHCPMHKKACKKRAAELHEEKLSNNHRLQRNVRFVF